MRTLTMCFSILQFSRAAIPRLAGFWRQSFHTHSRPGKNGSHFTFFSSKTSGLEAGYSRKWIKRPVSTRAGGRNKTQSNKYSDVRDGVSDAIVSASTTLNIEKAEITEFRKIEYSDVQQKIAENKELASLVTLIVFDLETTGFSRESERIIEIALQDLSGGENSTFQTLVNPGRSVPNAHIHGITTRMVNRPEVPRMKDLIPILFQFVGSRQKSGGYVLFIAHNARRFDVPFLLEEFNRCSFEVPANWLFTDTLPLARELMKSKGLKPSSGTSLQSLREYYKIPLASSAHRAMSDVNVLSAILQRLTHDLKILPSDLVQRSFKATDLNSVKKKRSSS
ncbi:exonuclease DPD1, chloroplastic/mitochondrial [Rhodamnia argentea]|uniref:Exonuclease DPD1, chloroplastic/mitochondrial n=1 Tax=Rhodamnia argentea TaxID=178133 RepID=A0A8B8QIJ1_9MYRT|nr:exonuclease DPD1, chloroplastic/mitochondrial [Rhodamnia argentea]XP_030547010.1 exonuclease DPD1, chloroplastic/mitochondrial [Rhodamnia argentea]XP_030547011.1 exonuclease DPD1, chloroplastic/mitochondrial [Rhodamnia argentea]XP_048131907.1 exonuclease DPD1, chloroplastic/mitochondrial [Rhodamnia argentea]XP_048131912.1 exonuclease DPD1, chloroplastic/mitochondrial [Rhodamnia argentea]XP_048131917.1 exonuclease DPD1, chloroplastic/mitochondrial [Rhodamnia argentea]XP_048131927.1 exonucle